MLPREPIIEAQPVPLSVTPPTRPGAESAAPDRAVETTVSWPAPTMADQLERAPMTAGTLDDLSGRPRYGCWNCRGREFVRINKPPTHEWFCGACQAPYPPEMILERWTSPLESMRAPTRREAAR